MKARLSMEICCVMHGEISYIRLINRGRCCLETIRKQWAHEQHSVSFYLESKDFSPLLRLGIVFTKADDSLFIVLKPKIRLMTFITAAWLTLASHWKHLAGSRQQLEIVGCSSLLRELEWWGSIQEIIFHSHVF